MAAGEEDTDQFQETRFPGNHKILDYVEEQACGDTPYETTRMLVPFPVTPFLVTVVFQAAFLQYLEDHNCILAMDERPRHSTP